MLRSLLHISLSLTAGFCLTISASAAETENWPGWRGPRGDGSSLEERIPTEWDGKSGRNIAWKTPIPGTGHSSPIVWEDRVFIVSCLSDTQERVLLSLDRRTGKIVWQTTVLKAPLENKHNLNSHASGTPATDGNPVYVTFLEIDGTMDVGGRRTPGEMVVAAYDFAGNQQWQVKPGRFASVHGYCSCPVIFEDKLIVNGDHDGDGYIVALDKTTGKEIWKINRPNNTRSYVTPIIREIAGKTQMILTGSKCTASYDPRTGKELWYMDGPTEQFVASPVFDGKYVYLTAGFPEYHILAIDPNHSGRLGDEAIQWRTTKACSYVPSPILCGEHFLIVSDNGIGSCYHATSGELKWSERMGRHYSASLVTAGGLVYFLDDDGNMKVVRPGEDLEIVATNKLGEYCYASPAITQGQLFIRGDTHLFCIGTKK
jgi:outer membrane protein assembly factor BamB